MATFDISGLINENTVSSLKPFTWESFKTNQFSNKNKKENSNKAHKKEGQALFGGNDSIEKLQKVKMRLSSKISEIFSSDMNDKMKEALIADINMQMAKVDRLISQIKAKQMEKATQGQDNKKSKKKNDSKKKTDLIYIKREYLYSKDKGGLDPSNCMFGAKIGSEIINPNIKTENSLDVSIYGVEYESGVEGMDVLA